MDTTSGNEITLAIGSDHAGYPLKEELRDLLESAGYHPQDFGTFSTESVDYPDIAREVADAVASGRFERGILVCGTGIGVSMVANKTRGIRAVACSEPYSAKMGRQHNNANILCVGSRVVGAGLGFEIALAFLRTDFEAGSRHARRVEKINAMDNR